MHRLQRSLMFARRSRWFASIIALVALAPSLVQAQEPLAAAPAEATAIPTQSLWQILIAGGPLVIPIVVCSFVLLLVVFERTVALRRSKVIPKLFVERFLLQISEGAVDRHGALELCDEGVALAEPAASAESEALGVAAGVEADGGGGVLDAIEVTALGGGSVTTFGSLV